jgi:hypothetical protein
VNPLGRGVLPSVLAAALAGAATGYARGATAQPRGSGEGSADSMRTARSLFQRGIELVGQERWGEALEYFRQSRALAERPSTVFNIGSVLVRVGRMAEAISALEEFLRISDPRANATERREAERLLAEARAARVGFELTLNVPDAELWIDGTQVAGAGAQRRLELNPGSHQIRVAAEGYEDESFTLSALSGQALQRDVRLRPRPTRILLQTVPPNAQASVDGRAVGRERLLEVSPGPHRVGLQAEQYLPLEREVSLRLGESLRLELALSRRPRTSIAASPWFWTAIGVVVVGTAVGLGVALSTTRLDPYGGTTETVLSGIRLRP